MMTTPWPQARCLVKITVFGDVRVRWTALMRAPRSGARFRSMEVVGTPEEPQGSESLLSFLLLSSLVPELGRELQDIALGPTRQQREDVTQVSPWLDAVALAAGDQSGCDGVPLGAIVAAAEGPIVPADHLPAELDLADVVVQTQSTVLKESGQRLALVDEVVQGFRERRFVHELRTLGRDPIVELGQDRFREHAPTLRVRDAGVRVGRCVVSIVQQPDKADADHGAFTATVSASKRRLRA